MLTLPVTAVSRPEERTSHKVGALTLPFVHIFASCCVAAKRYKCALPPHKAVQGGAVFCFLSRHTAEHCVCAHLIGQPTKGWPLRLRALCVYGRLWGLPGGGSDTGGSCLVYSLMYKNVRWWNDNVYMAEDFSSSPCVQTGSEAHPASYPMGTGGPFPRG
jgi:hypothetical protein